MDDFIPINPVGKVTEKLNLKTDDIEETLLKVFESNFEGFINYEYDKKKKKDYGTIFLINGIPKLAFFYSNDNKYVGITALQKFVNAILSDDGTVTLYTTKYPSSSVIADDIIKQYSDYTIPSLEGHWWNYVMDDVNSESNDENYDDNNLSDKETLELKVQNEMSNLHKEIEDLKKNTSLLLDALSKRSKISSYGSGPEKIMEMQAAKKGSVNEIKDEIGLRKISIKENDLKKREEILQKREEELNQQLQSIKNEKIELEKLFQDIKPR